MDFSFKGDYPVNQAKEVLGDEVYQVYIRCERIRSLLLRQPGKFTEDQKNNEKDKNVSWYKVYLSQTILFHIREWNLIMLVGAINSSEGLTKVNFDKIGIAGGEGTLSAIKNSEKTDHISLDIELKNADRNRLTRSLMKSSHLQDQEVEDADQVAE